ncbi:hypothetical protein GCM10009721_08900 [Terrabacter tumescens]|uniref:Uncharacterized protein n=1 Tax=Terrabacter tumescens TaxID=60443 RepID=A0ABQ2HMR7_9MICO|nr:hypothetical protein [Terrabacter tumescens]GGM86330.1 hypothetical protein GCM10009721_08900 [Terrabacter tumescens]
MSDKSIGAGSQVAEDAQYEHNEVRAIRGTEASNIAKWEKDGWELLSQNPGLLWTELTFRRPKPKTAGTYLKAFALQSYAAFRRLEPLTQKRAMAVCGSLVLLLVIAGVAVGIHSDSGSSTPIAAPNKAVVSASETQLEEPSQTATSTAPVAEAYTYHGPKYEIVARDEEQTVAKLDQYWIYTSKLDRSTAAYKDQVKLIIADIARDQATDKFLLEVVTNKEIALAESPSTMESFIAEHGIDYFQKTIPKKEKTEWVASYTGGFDSNAVEPSDTAFEIVWVPAGHPTFEKWRPETAD